MLVAVEDDLTALALAVGEDERGALARSHDVEACARSEHAGGKDPSEHGASCHQTSEQEAHQTGFKRFTGFKGFKRFEGSGFGVRVQVRVQVRVRVRVRVRMRFSSN